VGAVRGVEVEARSRHPRLKFVVVKLEDNFGAGVEVPLRSRDGRQTSNVDVRENVRGGVEIEVCVETLCRGRLGKDDKLNNGMVDVETHHGAGRASADRFDRLLGLSDQ